MALLIRCIGRHSSYYHCPMVCGRKGGTIMDLAAFLWTVIASIIGTVMGLTLMIVADKAYGIFNN